MTMSTENRISTSSRIIVAGIDLGTTYSGYAYSFKSDWTCVLTNEAKKLTSHKFPTALLLNPDKSFNSFGYEAEETYKDITLDGDDEGRSCKEYYFFHGFKKTLTKKVHRETTCKDKNGREAKAMLIFTLSIRYLKDHLLEIIRRRLGDKMNADDIDFVFTVPAIWNGTAKLFMREAAIQSGIPGNQIEIVVEPEAAMIYCHLMHLDGIQGGNTPNSFTRKAGITYMVLDLGGGTTDITVCKLPEDKTLTELVATSSEEWGGTNVDEAFRQFLEDIYGIDVLETFKSDPEYFTDYLEFWHYFENKKVNFSRFMINNEINVIIPLMLNEILLKQQRSQWVSQYTILMGLLKKSQYCDEDITVESGKLKMSKEFFKSFFNPTIDKLIAHLSRLFKDKLYSDIETVLIVGGFSECKLVQEQLKQRFGNTKRLVFPCYASLSVLKGAVYSGHCKDLTSHRVAMFTFGFQIWPTFDKSKYSRDRKKIVNGKERCRDVFLKMFTKGEPISSGLKKSLFFKPMLQGENVLECGIFVSNQKDPKYVDEPGCVKLDTLLVPLPNFERQKNVEIEESITYGETQIKVSANNCKSEEEHEIIIDLLSPGIKLPDI